MGFRPCEMCSSASPSPAVVYCDADACFLCASCDEDVHQANRFAQRHVRRPVSAAASPPESDLSDILVPDVANSSVGSSISKETTDLASEAGDMVYPDFEDFESVAFGKMPVLSASDADCPFFSAVPSSNLKPFDGDDLSWENVVPVDFDHVVPDVEVAPAPVKLTPVVVKRENMSEVLSDLKRTEASALAAKRPTGSQAAVGTEKQPDSPTVSNVTQRSSDSSGNADDPASSTESSSDACEHKTAEQRKQLRIEALVRFRNKRANRNFQKKIRYNCRKMLADSRPRVKGRFVKKSEMALYRRYGAEYRDHLDEVICDTLIRSDDVSMECV